MKFHCALDGLGGLLLVRAYGEFNVLTAMTVFLRWVRSERTTDVTRVFVDIRRVTGLDVGSSSERLRFEMSECIAESLP